MDEITKNYKENYNGAKLIFADAIKRVSLEKQFK